MTETRTIKIYSDTYRRLKVLAAKRGETMMGLIDRLVTQDEAAQLPTKLPTKAKRGKVSHDTSPR